MAAETPAAEGRRHTDAVAASLASEKDLPVQKVKYETLRALLFEGGQVLE
jgi:hypothetical protein